MARRQSSEGVSAHSLMLGVFCVGTIIANMVALKVRGDARDDMVARGAE